MIPPEILRLAIEGGWKHPEDGLALSFAGGDFWQMTLLDREFWIALGKAKKWDVKMMYYRCPADECDSSMEWAAKRFCLECGTRLEEWPTMTQNWLKRAEEFAHIIFTGGNTDKFWASLVNNKG